MKLNKLLPQSLGGDWDNYWNQFFMDYEEKVEKFYRKYGPYKLSIDAGAGVGYHTKNLAEISDKVIAIEPIKDPKLPENVDFYNVAVSDFSGGAKMKIDGEHVNGSKGAEAEISKEGEIEVKVVPIDSIVSSADFLKMDIEGHEGRVLRNCNLIDNVDYAVIETHGGFDKSILGGFSVREETKSERDGQFLFCIKEG